MPEGGALCCRLCIGGKVLMSRIKIKQESVCMKKRLESGVGVGGREGGLVSPGPPLVCK